MLSPSTATIRIFLHVIAASVWVGGQFALAGVVPTLRRVAPSSTKSVAQAFARLAWPAFGLTVITGMWNLMAVDITAQSSAYQATVLLKIAVAIMSGVFVAIHQNRLGGHDTRARRAQGWATGLIPSLANRHVRSIGPVDRSGVSPPPRR